MPNIPTHKEPRRGVTPAGLSARIMIGLRGGSTLRRFTVKASRFEAYCKAHPDYAREAKALLSENLQASNLRKGAAKRALTQCKYQAGGNARIGSGQESW
jgi:hypothetical protein